MTSLDRKEVMFKIKKKTVVLHANPSAPSIARTSVHASSQTPTQNGKQPLIAETIRRREPAEALAELLLSGWKLKIRHSRRFSLPYAGIFFGSRYEHPAVPPLAKGGFTIATLISPEGFFYQGTARCSRRDNYCKKIGRDIAVGRLAKKIVMEQPVRGGWAK